MVQKIHFELLENIMKFFSIIGNKGMVWIILGLILIIRKKTRIYGILYFLSLLVTVILGEGIMKNIIRRARPFETIDMVSALIKAPKSYSFPSGHTASSFAAFGIFYFLNLKYKWYIFLVAFLIAFSRIYLGVHFFTDIVGGIMLGLLDSYLISTYYKRNKDKILSNKFMEKILKK